MRLTKERLETLASCIIAKQSKNPGLDIDTALDLASDRFPWLSSGKYSLNVTNAQVKTIEAKIKSILDSNKFWSEV